MVPRGLREWPNPMEAHHGRRTKCLWPFLGACNPAVLAGVRYPARSHNVRAIHANGRCFIVLSSEGTVQNRDLILYPSLML